MSPVKASVRVALVLPEAPPVTLATERPLTAGLVTSAKLDAETPEAKVVPPSERVTVALFQVGLGERGRAGGDVDGGAKTRCEDWLTIAPWRRSMKPPAHASHPRQPRPHPRRIAAHRASPMRFQPPRFGG